MASKTKQRKKTGLFRRPTKRFHIAKRKGKLKTQLKLHLHLQKLIISYLNTCAANQNQDTIGTGYRTANVLGHFTSRK